MRSGDQIVVDREKSFFRDILLPALGIIGSIASIGLLIDRISRQQLGPPMSQLAPSNRMLPGTHRAAAPADRDRRRRRRRGHVPPGPHGAAPAVSAHPGDDAGRRVDRAVPGLAGAGRPITPAPCSDSRASGSALTGDDEEAPGLPKTTDPHHVHRRADQEPDGRGAVVDYAGSAAAELDRGVLDRRSDAACTWIPRAAGDSVVLTFRPSDVVARRADRTVTAPYGQIINLGVVQFSRALAADRRDRHARHRRP